MREASVAANEAAVRQAELDLEFTELRAPVTGRIGDRRVSPGNLVTGGTGGNTTLLATIVSIDPIRFEFTFDEASLPALRAARRGGQRTSPAAATASTSRLKLIDEQRLRHRGRMDFVDNVIDRATGTIRGRARVRQSGRPVHARHVRARAGAGLAALSGAAGAGRRDRHRAGAQIRLVVDAENIARAEIRDARPARRTACASSRTGSAPDDRVIVNGLMRARPGAKVTPQEQGAPPPGDGAPAPPDEN